MVKLEYSQNALDDIERLVDFLIGSDLLAALSTFEVIDDGVQLLKRHPEIGRLVAASGKRELVISRGNTGYIAIYAFDKFLNVVVILAIKHQREADFN